MKQHEIDNIEKLTLRDFYSSYPDIAESKEPVAIKRFGAVDGYFVPAELFEELMQLRELHSKDMKGD